MAIFPVVLHTYIGSRLTQCNLLSSLFTIHVLGLYPTYVIEWQSNKHINLPLQACNVMQLGLLIIYQNVSNLRL